MESSLQTQTDVFDFSFSSDERSRPLSEILQEADAAVESSLSISRVFSSTYYVYDDEPVDDVVECFNDLSSLLAIGVANREGVPLGVIVRRELFNILGKSYGKDLVEDRTAAEVMREVKIFEETDNIYGVSTALHEEMEAPEIRYCAAVNGTGTFAGVFSTRDILLYMAKINQRDFSTAQQIQSRIVRENEEFSNDHFNLVCHSTMAMGVGGDYYMLKKYSSSSYHLSIADVSGKGISASLITAVACGMAASYNFSNGLTGFVKDINDYVFNTFNSEKFITGIFMNINCEKNRMTLCDMGHGSILFIRKGKFCTFKGNETNLPLGITPENTVNTGSLLLEPGDLIFISTDGIAEQTNPDGIEYGDERIRKILYSARDKSPEEIKNILWDDINSFKGKQPQKDDLTFLIFQWK